MQIWKSFRFSSAHFLPNVPEWHKCRRVHGHGYLVTITLQGDPNPASGWLCDFADIKATFAPLLERLDHQLLNDLGGRLTNPTAENLATFIAYHLQDLLPDLWSVAVAESEDCGVVIYASELRQRSATR